MGKRANTPANRKGRSKIDDELDSTLARREHDVEAVVAAATDRRAKTIAKATAKADRRFKKDVGKAPKKGEKLDAKLTTFLERNWYWLTRRHGKTITRPDGVIKVVLRAPEMDAPVNEQEAINFLLQRPGGKKYLTVTYKLNRRALLHAPSELKAALRPLGFWWGKHRTISVTSPSSSKSKELSRRRYNERS